jgi:hypothetical protein
MFRILLIAIAACTLSASPAFSQMSPDRQKQMQKRESSGESVTQNQRGGLKKDRQISREIFRSAHNRMRDRDYRHYR